MAAVTTFRRAQAATSASSVVTRDTTPSALGTLGTIIVTEDVAQDGGASVVVVNDASTWSGRFGVAMDPRTGRPMRAAPWLPAWPTDLLALVTEYPLSAYITAPSTLTYAPLVAALASQLGEWGWTSTQTTD